MHDRIEFQILDNRPQEVRLLAGAVDKMDFGHAKNTKNYAGETGTRAYIRECFRRFRDEFEKLGAVKEMPLPYMRQSALGHQIEFQIPFGQQFGIAVELGQCFTWNIALPDKLVALGWGHFRPLLFHVEHRPV